MELAVHAAALAAGDFAIQLGAGEYAGREDFSVYKFAYREGIQCRCAAHVPGASADGDLCRLQQRPAEPEPRLDARPTRFGGAVHGKGLYQRQPAVFREGFVSVPVLKNGGRTPDLRRRTSAQRGSGGLADFLVDKRLRRLNGTEG